MYTSPSSARNPPVHHPLENILMFALAFPGDVFHTGDNVWLIKLEQHLPIPTGRLDSRPLSSPSPRGFIPSDEAVSESVQSPGYETIHPSMSGTNAGTVRAYGRRATAGL